MTTLSPHFSLHEFTITLSGLPNAIPATAIPRLRALCTVILEPLRAALGTPITVTSGWRSIEVNAAVGGSKHSQHLYGEAADIETSPYVDHTGTTLSATRIVRALWDLGLDVDQVIGYDPARGGHVHVSYTTARKNRREFLWCPAGGPKTYVKWER